MTEFDSNGSGRIFSFRIRKKKKEKKEVKRKGKRKEKKRKGKGKRKGCKRKRKRSILRDLHARDCARGVEIGNWCRSSEEQVCWDKGENDE